MDDTIFCINTQDEKYTNKNPATNRSEILGAPELYADEVSLSHKGRFSLTALV